eukprot:GHVU01023999.1.p1 GENE.GHVU01023999.1~~GHVU01023999.1.p1  ORF type:complete len:514 (+),score=43.55 GHVU01023999.1:246-1787(+)
MKGAGSELPLLAIFALALATGQSLPAAFHGGPLVDASRCQSRRGDSQRHGTGYPRVRPHRIPVPPVSEDTPPALEGPLPYACAFHCPVLCNEAAGALVGNTTGVYVDCTAGGGGHTLAVLRRLGSRGAVICLDADPAAIRHTRRRAWDARRTFSAQLVTVHARFGGIKEVLNAVKFAGAIEGFDGTVDGVLADFGLSTHQINSPSRGFSWAYAGPLDMRFDAQHEMDSEDFRSPPSTADAIRSSQVEQAHSPDPAVGVAVQSNAHDASTAGDLAIGDDLEVSRQVVADMPSSWPHFEASETLQRRPKAIDILSRMTAAELAEMLRRYADEPMSRRIAAAIVERMQSNAALRTTTELRDVVLSCLPCCHRDKNKTLARVFQSIRISVNDEENEIVRLLDAVGGVIREGGRLITLSYHSGEDRIVKRFAKTGMTHDFRPPPVNIYGDCLSPFRPIGKVMRPGEDEVWHNSRSRSARLRVAERTDRPTLPRLGDAIVHNRRRHHRPLPPRGCNEQP